MGVLPPLESIPKIKRACSTAMTSAESPELIYTLLAMTAFLHEWDWPRAKHYIYKALALNANVPELLMILSNWNLIFETQKESYDALDKAIAIDPLNPHFLWLRVFLHYQTRRYEDAIQCAESVLEIAPEHSETFQLLSQIYIQTGEYDQALEHAQRTYDLQLGYGYSAATLAIAHVKMNNEDKALELLQEVLDRADKEYVMPVGPTIMYAALGDMDNAFVWLNRCYEQRESMLRHIELSGTWDDFRGHPQFDEVVRRMNFPAGQIDYTID